VTRYRPSVVRSTTYATLSVSGHKQTLIIYFHHKNLLIDTMHSTSARLTTPQKLKFPDISLTICRTPAHVKWCSYHFSTNWMLLNTHTNANIQLTVNSFWPLCTDKIFFPDTSLTFSKIPDIALTAVKIPDISRSSRQWSARSTLILFFSLYIYAMPVVDSDDVVDLCSITWQTPDVQPSIVTQ